MAKYPNHGGYSKILSAGCGGSIIMIILTALCPPLVIIFWAIYSAYDSSSQNTKDTLQNGIVILIIGFVLIAAPVVTILSFFIMGVEETLSNGGWFLALITVVEIIVIWHIIIKNYQNKKMLENETPEEREARLKKEKAQQREYEEQLKFKRLNTPTDHNNSKHVCNIYLYDKFSDEYKLKKRIEILKLIQQGINLSQPTWEVYYYRMVENNPDFPPKDKQ